MIKFNVTDAIDHLEKGVVRKEGQCEKREREWEREWEREIEREREK